VLCAFCFFTITWIVWGLLTPGDYFANGNSFAFPSLGVAALVGLIFGFRATVRLRLLIFAASIAGLGFWILVPEGWWAKAPPTRIHVSELLARPSTHMCDYRVWT
jgi:hypothetical protein